MARLLGKPGLTSLKLKAGFLETKWEPADPERIRAGLEIANSQAAKAVASRR
jgi:hypothetical protein